MTYESFKEILAFIEPYITLKESGVMGAHQTISAAQRLVLTIRFLATGETYKSLSFQFRVSERALSYIVDEVTKTITEYIGKEYMKIPSSLDDWNKISEKFASRWNLPNCIGAIDGKHILVRPPHSFESIKIIRFRKFELKHSKANMLVEMLAKLNVGQLFLRFFFFLSMLAPNANRPTLLANMLSGSPSSSESNNILNLQSKKYWITSTRDVTTKLKKRLFFRH
ncbi:uncharacterized protein LOC130645955 [Hydractinia symbiolongicarpus]|uniref:uncharacterized protein LOC130645955 n=1 Tax=Hydractinia symbiolongicarpus TaxID=13093 RepID=UPI00254B7871|nr:uncharacterized protein LOC130645955 [Hydractinia symbiolongicarpus]